MSHAASPPGENRADTGWYVYGVVAAAEGGALVEAPEGVDSSAGVAVIADGRLGAVASRVSLDEFGEGSLEENLRDAAWLEEKVRAHEAVLEAAVERTPVVPFRFGTIYRGREQVLAMLSEHREDFSAALERVRGRVELGVKAILDPERFAERRRADSGEGNEPQSAGRAYLLERQRERQLAEAAETFAAECARVSHERLSRAAEAARANPLRRPELAGGPGEMLLNGAYLLRVDEQERFRATLAELESRYAADGVVYALTGPWPPYNFVSPAEDT